MRTLIFHDGALGDALLSLPSITEIGRHAAPLDAVCRDDVGRLLRASGTVQGSFSSDSGAFSSWYAGSPDNAARELLDRYNRVFVFTREAGSGLVQNIARIVPYTRAIITVPRAGDRTHVAQFRLRQVPHALRDAVPVRLAIPPDLRRQASEILSRAGHDGQGCPIVLHPGSGGKRKCWPLERYFTLAEQLAARPGPIILFLSGPAEEGEVQERIGKFVKGRKGMGHVAGRDLLVVAGLLAECGLYIGNDSGISHLAAATGAPMIAFFGPTDPALWAPQGERVRVIAAETLEDISVDAVLAAAEAAVLSAPS